MNVDYFEIFTVKADQIYAKMQADVEPFLSQITKLQYEEPEVVAIQQRIFNNIFKYEVATLGSEVKNIISEDLHVDNASRLIGNGFTFSLSSATTLITQLTYTYPSFKGMEGLKVTVKYPKRTLSGKLVRSFLSLDFYIQGNNVSEQGPRIKTQKDQLLALIEDNNKDVSEYFEGRKQNFLDYIRFKIEEKLTANNKHQADLNSF